MANKYAVIRTDNLSGTDQRADLLSVRVYDEDGTNMIEIENGVIVKVGELEVDGEREIYKASPAKAGDDLNECAILAAPEIMYDECHYHTLDQYINEAGKAIRAYIPRNRNFFGVTAEGFVDATPPAKGGKVGIGAGGKLDASADGVGTCVAIEQAGQYTFYVIHIEKA